MGIIAVSVWYLAQRLIIYQLSDGVKKGSNLAFDHICDSTGVVGVYIGTSERTDPYPFP
jgi:hypothetical protein